MPEIFGAALMGGGSGPAFAAIGAIYPVGAVCTCSYNGQTLTAKDTSGRALFLVPSAGQWLVKATNGGQEVEDTVSITTQGQVASVTLAFFSATIVCTFPVDCTAVTCTKGDIVFNVPSGSLSSGSYTFAIPEAGEWTLYCTNGIDTDTDTVNVTEETAYSVVLSFLYYLYNTGDECTEITGGWKARKQGSRGTFTKKETSLYIQGVANNGMNAATTNKIDLTPFATAKIRLIKVSNSGSGNFFFSTSSGYTESGSGTLSLSTVTKPKIVSLDITSLNGLYYAVFLSLNGKEIEFDQMWLEE